jgi:general secretion pathway protein F
MKAYRYTAHQLDGTMAEGEVEAQSLHQALLELRSRGLYVARLKEKRESWSFQLPKIHRRDRKKEALFCQEIAILLHAGIPRYDSMSLLSANEASPLASLMKELKERIGTGQPLSQAMAGFNHIFSPLSIELVRVGESSGQMTQVMSRLADWLERQLKSQEKIKTILFYPAFLLLATLALGIFLLCAVLPTFASFFESMQAELPLPTQMLLWLSSLLLEDFPLLLAGAAVLVFLCLFFYQQPFCRYHIDRGKLRLPLWGTLLQENHWYHIMSACFVLTDCGITLDKAVEQAAQVTGNAYLRSVLMNLSQGIKNGFSLSELLKKEKYLPVVLLELMKVGEEAGCLSRMFFKGADYCASSAENHSARLQAMAEPLSVIIVALVIGAFVASVMLPWMNLMDAVSLH